MSRELIGSNGEIFGSGSYLARLNRNYHLDEFLIIDNNYRYYNAMTDFANKMKYIIEEIHSDLIKNANILSYIDISERKELSDIIKGLNRFCEFMRISVSSSSRCINLLNLYDSTTKRKSSASNREIDTGVRLIKNGGKSNISSSDRIYLVKKVINYGINYACGNDIKKTTFINEILNGRDMNFLIDVWNKYSFEETKREFKGKCGKIVCSNEYCQYVLKTVFNGKTSLRFMSENDRNYTDKIKMQFEALVNEMRHDLYSGKAQNDFVKDNNGELFSNAVTELEKIGIRCYDLKNRVSELMWYVGGDFYKIKKLQSNLNTLGIQGTNGRLKEDGVFGKETLSAWNEITKSLLSGSVPVMTYTDILQSNLTGVVHKLDNAEIKDKKRSHNPNLLKNMPDNVDYSVLLYPVNGKLERAFMLDLPHGNHSYFHINYPVGKPAILKKYLDHRPISEATYVKFKNFQNIGKVVHAGGRRLLVAGVLLDSLELGTTILEDLNDADKKIGKKTGMQTIKIGGRWAGGAIGTKIGAMAGASIGTVVPVIGTAVGGAIGGFIGGIAGSMCSDEILNWVFDITDIYE